MKKIAAVLFSGGLDSSTVLCYAQSLGFEVHALSFFYGQKNNFELEYASRFAKKYNVKHVILNIDQNLFMGSNSSLIKKDKKVEMGKDVKPTEIPNTYVPARNMLFISHGISYLESLGGLDLFIGVNTVDYGNYPDCRKPFINLLESAATSGSKECNEKGFKYKIHTPIIDMSKADIIKMGTEIDVDYSQTLSCYNPSENGLACGLCLSCTTRKNGFKDANIKDPTIYI